MLSLRTLLLSCIAALIPLMALGKGSGSKAPPVSDKGSGSKASLSILELDDPLPACLIEGAEIARDPEQGVDHTVESAFDTLIWAITFDQSLVEIEFEDEFFFARSEHVEVQPCESLSD